MNRRRATQKSHSREMVRLAANIASYTDNQLRERAANPQQRADLESIVTTCSEAISQSTGLVAKAVLKQQMRRLERALESQAVAV